MTETTAIKQPVTLKDMVLYGIGCIASGLAGFLLCALITHYW